MIDWPKFPKNMTTFQGASPGKAALRGMETEAGGMGGIRRIERRDPDGTIHVLNTRGGFPEVVTSHAKPRYVVSADRTFVFAVFGAKSAVVANRVGSGLRVGTRGLVVGKSVYGVGRVRSDSKVRWNDVVRLDGVNLKYNGLPPTSYPAKVYSPGSAGVPYLSSYDTTCADNAALSTLFIAEDSRVELIGISGSVTEAFDTNTAMTWSDASEAGVFTGYYALLDFSTYSNFTPTSISTGWAKVQATPLRPYLAGAGKKNSTFEAFTYTADDTYSHALVWQTPIITEETSGRVTTHTAVLPGPRGGLPSEVVAYAGSDVEIVMSGHATGGGSTVTVTVRDEFGYAVSTTRNSFVNADFAITHTSKRFGPVITYATVAEMSSADTYVSTFYSRTTTRSSVDHIFADFAEGIFLTLRVNYTASAIGTYVPNDPSKGPELSGTASMSYVLDIRGSLHVLQERNYVMSGLHTDDRSYDRWPVEEGGVDGSPLRHGAVFSPLWMSQSNCPFIAYTTKAEEAAGATPEFYLDLSLCLQTPGGEGQQVPTVSSTTGVKFTPMNFMLGPSVGLTWNHPGVWSAGFGPLVSKVWRALFPLDVPDKLQFANGAKGSWTSQLGAGFEGSPIMDISRI